MRREYCDRCGTEVTGKQSSAIHGIADADAEGNGTHTQGFHIVCRRCYRLWLKFMAAAKKGAA